MEYLLITLALMVILALYMLPTLVAFKRGHESLYGITIINIALGWTGVMWLGCMVWARDEEQGD